MELKKKVVLKKSVFASRVAHEFCQVDLQVILEDWAYDRNVKGHYPLWCLVH